MKLAEWRVYELSLTIEPRQSYLYVIATGNFDLYAAQNSFRKIFSAVAQHNLSKVLIDLRPLEGNMSTMDRFSLAEFVSSERFEHEGTVAVRLAVVGKHPIVEPQRFGETVARNRGVNVCVMTDIDDALEWLDISAANESSGGDVQ